LSVGIDTSVLVRLLVGEPAAQAAKAKARLLAAHLAGEAVVASDLVIAQTWHALQDHYKLQEAAVREALLAMLASGLVQLEPGSGAGAALREKGAKKVGFVDRLIRARGEAAGRVTLTLDRAQGRLGRAEYIG
jgi:predicted nucleic-acid-binding protein